MDKHQENYLIDKIEKYLDNPSNTKIQDNMILSLEEITLTGSDFLKIAGEYLMKFNKNLQMKYEEKLGELKLEYDELKENLKENNPLKEKLDKIKEIYNNIDKSKEELSNLLNED